MSTFKYTLRCGFQLRDTSWGGGWQTVCHSGVPASVPGQLNLWCTRWHWGRFFSQYFEFSPVRIIPPMLYTYSFIYHRRCIISLIDSVDKYITCMYFVLTTVVEGRFSIYFKSFYQKKTQFSDLNAFISVSMKHSLSSQLASRLAKLMKFN